MAHKMYKANLKYFKGGVYLKFGKYGGNQRTAITLFSLGEYSPIAIATVNMPEIKLNNGEVIIKSYSENEGMNEFISDNKIGEDTGRVADNGYVACKIFKLLVNLSS